MSDEITEPVDEPTEPIEDPTTEPVEPTTDNPDLWITTTNIINFHGLQPHR